MENERAKPRLVSREVLQAHLDRQPDIKHKVFVRENRVTGEAVYLEVTQVGDQPPVVQTSNNSPSE